MGKEERGKCKYCGSQKLVKNGRVRGEQRYKCKGCGKNVTLKPRRGKPEEMKAAAILLYSVGKISMNMLGKIFKVSTVAVYKWIRQTAEKLPEPAMPAGPSEWELDEMWHFVRSKKTNAGYGKPWIGAQGVLCDGWWASVILKPLKASTAKFNTPNPIISATNGKVIQKPSHLSSSPKAKPTP